jgi:hypothetical protein
VGTKKPTELENASERDFTIKRSLLMLSAELLWNMILRF